MEKYGLIGRNIGYSQSPALHKIIGNYEYEIIDVQDEAELEKALNDRSFSGFNVTVPYKNAVMKYLDKVSDGATCVDAVNTIKRMPDGSLAGFNTDIYGFKEMVGDRVSGRKCLIFGTGGAARSVAAGLDELGAASVVYVSRDPDEAKDKLKDGRKVISYEALHSYYDTQVVVNATPIGGLDTIDQSSITNEGKSLRIFSSLELAVDLIYNPYRTKFLQDARRLTGCKTMSGLSMLIHQAIASRNIWLGDKQIPLFEKVAMSAIKRKLLINQLNIIAVGMPGCGKTSIFRRYAYELKLDFFDTDAYAEKLMGEKIEDVLAPDGKGEEYFREFEQKAILEASKLTKIVIATGGGSVLNPINRDLLRSNGIVVYVKRPMEMLAVQGRPISQQKGVEELFEQRDRIYQRVSDVVIHNSGYFGKTVEKNGNPNSFSYDMKMFVYHIKAKIDKYIFDIAGNKWT